MTFQFEAEHKVVVTQNMQMLGLRANLDKHTTQNNLNNMKISRLSADLDNLVQVRDKLNNDLNTKNNILKLKEDENAKFRLENAKILKSREMLMKKMMNVEASKTSLENEIIKLKWEGFLIMFWKTCSNYFQFDLQKHHFDIWKGKGTNPKIHWTGQKILRQSR